MIQATARQHSEQDLFALDRQDGSKHKRQERHGAVEDTRDDSMGKRRQIAAQKRGSSSARSCQEAMYQIATILSPASFFEHKLLLDATQLAAGSMESESVCNVAAVALGLQARGYSISVRRVMDSREYWARSMATTFMICSDTSSGQLVEYVVDPNFKELFRIAYASPAYKHLWDSVPSVFVGMPCQLLPTAQLLCEEVELSFLEAGRPLPPWRTAAATISRWMSDCFTEMHVPAPSARPQEVHTFLEQCSQLGSCTPSPCSSPRVGSTAAASRSSMPGTPYFRPERQLLGFEPSSSGSGAGAPRRSRPVPAAASGFDSDASSASSSSSAVYAPPAQQQQQQQSSSQQATAQRIIAALQPMVVVQQQQQQQAAARPERPERQLIHPAQQAVDAAALYQGAAGAVVPLCPQPATLGGVPSTDTSSRGSRQQQQQQATAAAASQAAGAAGAAAQPAKKRSLLSEKLGELRKWETAVKSWNVPSMGLFHKPQTPQLR